MRISDWSSDVCSSDLLGRPLPRWSGCHTLGPSEVFLMNPTVPDSLDGRYFGPLPTTALVARAEPLWTDEAGAGRFVRSEARRGGKEGVSACRTRWWP